MFERTPLRLTTPQKELEWRVARQFQCAVQTAKCAGTDAQSKAWHVRCVGAGDPAT